MLLVDLVASARLMTAEEGCDASFRGRDGCTGELGLLVGGACFDRRRKLLDNVTEA